MLSQSSRILLLAGVSIAALTAVSGHAKAADMATKAPPPVAAAKDTKDSWAWWVEGGTLGIAGKAISFGPIAPIRPKLGWEGAVGFDWTGQPLSPWHLSGQFRYGQANKSQAFSAASVSTPAFTATSLSLIGTQDIKESHRLLDFAVGRDFALGTGQGQLKFGVRIADLTARLSGRDTFTSSTGGIFFEQKSRFLGAGPRIGVEGSTPLGGAWSLDWLAGAALLVGERTLEIFASASETGVAQVNTGRSRTLTAAVPNLEAQLGLAYWFSPGLKLTASYRFDGYFGALSTINASLGTVTVDRFYHGPMLRLTYVTSAPSSIALHNPALAAAYNWAGFYVGPNVGCGWSQFSMDQFAVSDPGGFPRLQSNGDGCFVGGQLGYNYQFANNLVAGVEADAALADITGQGAVVEELNEGAVYRQKIKDFGTMRGRLGYAYGQALPYVTGGWAWARNSLNVHGGDTAVGGTVIDMTDSKLHSGWTLGAGLEYAVTAKWSVKGEYLYADLGTKRYAVVVDGDIGVPPGANLDLKMHTFKLGANYHW